MLGFFNPLTKEKKLKADRVEYWLSCGAQPSSRVHNLLVEEKIIEEKKIDVHKKPKKNPAGPEAMAGEEGKPSAEAKEASKEAPKKEEKKEEPSKGEVKNEAKPVEKKKNTLKEANV